MSAEGFSMKKLLWLSLVLFVVDQAVFDLNWMISPLLTYLPWLAGFVVSLRNEVPHV